MNSPSIEIRRLVLGPFQSNCYLVRAPGSRSAVAIDPGAEPDRIQAALDAWEAELEAILLTHAHLDHVGAVGALTAGGSVPVYLHPDDLPLYRAAPRQAEAFGLSADTPPEPEHELRHGERVEVAGLSFAVRHAPGHSPGGVVLVGDGHAFVGDCVFAGSIGRTDLPGGDPGRLLRSIREQILTLPEETILLSGHGPETTVGREASSNPFLTGAFGWSG